MKPAGLLARKAGLGFLALVLVVGFGWVVARSSPSPSFTYPPYIGQYPVAICP